MPQPFVFRTIDLDGQTIRTAVRPGKDHLTPLLIFNGIGANLELVSVSYTHLDVYKRQGRFHAFGNHRFIEIGEVLFAPPVTRAVPGTLNCPVQQSPGIRLWTMERRR